jgi:hypothetical protein
MGEPLIIVASLRSAARILEIIKDPELLEWEESIEHLNVLAKWLPKKGFKILPKILDMSYRPGTIGDEADKLITKIRGCYLGTPGGLESTIPVWDSVILEQQQLREELKRILKEEILDISFEEELAKEFEKIFGEALRKADERNLKDDNENLKELAKVLMRLAKCIDQIKKGKEEGKIPFIRFEFYIVMPS